MPRLLSEEALGGKKPGADHSIDEQCSLEAEALENARSGEFHGKSARRRSEGETSRCKRGEPESDLQHQRHERRHRSDADPEDAASDHAGVKSLDIEEPQVD